MDIERLKFIAYNVFERFNGRVNNVNRAILIINDLNMYGSAAAAISYTPNIIEFYPRVIDRIIESEELKPIVVAETIIHELSHQDQDIDFGKIILNDTYRAYIEISNDKNTSSFILSNVDEISKVAQLTYEQTNVMIDRANNLLRDSISVNYAKKLGFLNHVLNVVFEGICCGSLDDKIINDNLNIIIDAYKSHAGITVDLILDNDILRLIYNGIHMCNVDIFNAFINNHYNSKNSYGYSITIQNPSYCYYTIEVNLLDQSKIMCIYNTDIAFKED
jgi:hypothetical protein